MNILMLILNDTQMGEILSCSGEGERKSMNFQKLFVSGPYRNQWIDLDLFSIYYELQRRGEERREMVWIPRMDDELLTPSK